MMYDLKLPQPTTSADLARLLQLAGTVRRNHVVPDAARYTVAEHTWGMMAIYVAFHPAPQLQTMVVMLLHDVPELWTGDIPGPVKSAEPALKKAMDVLEERVFLSLGLGEVATEAQLGEVELLWLKGCDVVELALHCERQRYSHPLYYGEVLANCRKYIRGAKSDFLGVYGGSAKLTHRALLALYDSVLEDTEGFRDFTTLRIWT